MIITPKLFSLIKKSILVGLSVVTLGSVTNVVAAEHSSKGYMPYTASELYDALDNVYLGVRTGIFHMRQDLLGSRIITSDVPFIGAVVGYDFNTFKYVGFRTELEYFHFRTAKDTADYEVAPGMVLQDTDFNIRLNSLFINGIVDLYLNRNLRGYAIGGIGLNRGYLIVNNDTYGVRERLGDSKHPYAHTYGGGLKYDFDENLGIDLSVRYANLYHYKGSQIKGCMYNLGVNFEF